MKYITVTPLWVIDEIARGNTVYVLDKEVQEVFNLGDMKTSNAIAIIECAKEQTNRYLFWYEKENVENETV